MSVPVLAQEKVGIQLYTLLNTIAYYLNISVTLYTTIILSPALSFLLSFIARVVYKTTPSQRASPQGLILAPTRELCMQIEEQAKELLAG